MVAVLFFASWQGTPSGPGSSSPISLPGASPQAGAGSGEAIAAAPSGKVVYDDLPDSSAFGAASVTPDRGGDGSEEDEEFDYEEFNPYALWC